MATSFLEAAGGPKLPLKRVMSSSTAIISSEALLGIHSWRLMIGQMWYLGGSWSWNLPSDADEGLNCDSRSEKVDHASFECG